MTGGPTAALRDYVPLLKLKIGLFITLSAVVGALLTGRDRIGIFDLIGLSVVLLLGSAAASVYNHYHDRDIDAVMARTKDRPIASGRLRSLNSVLFLGAVLMAASLILAFALFNLIVALHVLAGAFVYAVVYTVWLKRRSVLNIVIGGLAGSFAVLAGAASVTPELCAPPLLLALVMFFWTPSHFWSLAIACRSDYARAGVPMLPVVVGNVRAARYLFANTVLLVLASIGLWLWGGMGLVYLLPAVGVGAFFLYRNAQLLRDASQGTAWSNFKASMAYLAILYLAVIADVASASLRR